MQIVFTRSAQDVQQVVLTSNPTPQFRLAAYLSARRCPLELPPLSAAQQWRRLSSKRGTTEPRIKVKSLPSATGRVPVLVVRCLIPSALLATGDHVRSKMVIDLLGYRQLHVRWFYTRCNWHVIPFNAFFVVCSQPDVVSIE